MKIINVDNKTLKKDYLNFIYKIYKNDYSFKDTLIGVVKTFLNKSDTFTKQTYTRPIIVKDDNCNILAICMFIYNQLLPVMQVGFFEALENQDEAIDALINEAKIEAKKFNLKKVVIGLNGHVSYGVGLLCDQYDKTIPFDSLYNKDYYIKYFDKYHFQKSPLTTYYFQINNKTYNREQINKIYSQYSFRYLDLKKYKEEMFLFGKLCNETLKDTYLYYDRDPICMYELLKELKPFLKPENLIFAMKEGKEIGFIFWHPDFNEIIPGGKKNSMLEIGLKFILKKHLIKNIIINAVGILEPYKRSTVAMGLVYEIYKNTHDKYFGAESNFVWDSNIDSTNFNRRNMDRVSRHYIVYEINL